ncbi:hypothetical protein BpHYR1_005024 [Brachionus plicatilis]|uniref:Uncharacterized protein n=1 Tax=Brachionus plicatilis TaxID=10195 RepID=A0A3M7PVV0_BRAPC|nr:hypothetical protein BpHYR1_005024 [Brachionus plicatilis]
MKFTIQTKNNLFLYSSQSSFFLTGNTFRLSRKCYEDGLIGKLKFKIKIKRSKYKLENINFFKNNYLTCHVNRKIKLFQFE